MSSFRRTTEFEERAYSPPRRFDEDIRRTTSRTFVEERERDDGRRLPSFLTEEYRRTDAGPVVLHDSSSPEPELQRTRIVETERVRSPSEPRGVRFREEMRRPRTPPDEREHIRIVERERETVRSPEPSRTPSPLPPRVVRGPTVEQDVITHRYEVDHGTIPVRRPEPRPRIIQDRRETDIDIQMGRHHTEVDIRRARSRDRRAPPPEPEMIVNNRIHLGKGRPRARSEVVMYDEGQDIASRIDARGRMGEARGGATRNWTILDVPPGTERVRMDGAGGGRTNTQWSQYSGVRRTKFIPDRDGFLVPAVPGRSRSRGAKDKLHVHVNDRDRDIDIDIERTRRRRKSAPATDIWTELSKDLVSREAMQRLGYTWEDRGWVYYVMDYLSYVSAPKGKGSRKLRANALTGTSATASRVFGAD